MTRADTGAATCCPGRHVWLRMTPHRSTRHQGGDHPVDPAGRRRARRRAARRRLRRADQPALPGRDGGRRRLRGRSELHPHPLRTRRALPPTGDVSGAGLELVPASLAATCRHAHHLTGLPVLVTEHGADLDDDRDQLRGQFIESSLGQLAAAIADGVDVRGYLHWSLMDNYEWFNGYHGHFGLLGVDRNTQQRRIRPSATVLGRIAHTNRG